MRIKKVVAAITAVIAATTFLILMTSLPPFTNLY